MHLPNVKALRRLLRTFQFSTTYVVAALAISACGGGSGDASLDKATAPSGFSVSYDTKGYLFHWDATAGATHYELFEDPDGLSPLPEAQVGGAIAPTSYAHSLAAQLLHERVNANYRLRACNASGCGAFTSAVVPDLAKAIGYFKASNSDQGKGLYGASVTLSADGSTLAVGAPDEGSKSTGINGDQADDSLRSAGAVYVFTRSSGGWSQQAYIKASNNREVLLFGSIPLATARFGTSVSLSSDGNTLAVGAPDESSNARGVDGNQTDAQTPGAGSAYVFTRSSGAWSQHAYVKASNTQAKADIVIGLGVFGVRYPAQFGSSVALSADGRVLAVSAPGDTSNAKGINGNQQDTSAPFAGAVYVFARTPASWTQQAYIKASNTAEQTQFGSALALSEDGRTLAVGSKHEHGASSGINGAQTGSGALFSGAAYVYVHNGDGQWSQQAYVKSSNADAFDSFGYSVALSADGNTLAVGAPKESSDTDGINKAPGPRSLIGAGAAYVFTRSNSNWSQQAFIKPSKAGVNAAFGSSLALSADGNTLAVASTSEAGSGKGFNANQAELSAGAAGAAYIFQRSGSAWTQKAYVKASNTDPLDHFGASIALSADGTTMAAGATGEGSLATGIQGNQADNSGAPVISAGGMAGVGAVYLY
ncbi:MULTISPECIES: FG-GAP repeat protein [Acidovorax]|uniref:Integrin n=1 Tax=Acidovorax facilis TaxID=12917 RepID=A0ABV8DCW7_9BURK|nr:MULTISPECIES: FG-GAP repeat protein [Acidovorax]MBO1007431.1 FG-GAP repeat protein [Acidovorax sp. SD340]MCO4241904.1 FG-GAP repeat protein [Acidovorax facilis]